MPNDFPEFLKWIPETQTIINYEQHRDNVKNCLSEANLIFTLDFNALNRTGDLAQELMTTKADFILIDHHQEPDDYALVTYSDVGMSSTSEMVYHFIEFIGGLNLLNKEIATQLYVGIMTDTGSFRFPATTAATHRVIAHLIEAGAPASIRWAITLWVAAVVAGKRKEPVSVIIPTYNCVAISLFNKLRPPINSIK